MPQFPYDPSSGAARTTTTIAELLAEAGCEVRIVATSATEDPSPLSVASWATEMQLDATTRAFDDFTVHELERRGLGLTVLDTGRARAWRWNAAHDAMLDRLFDRELAQFRPDVLFMYGGQPTEVARRRRARAAGARILFGLYNPDYLVRGFFDDVDSVIVPSEFLRARYAAEIGLESTVVPTPLRPEDVIAERTQPTYLTMVNASLEKGLMLFVRLLEMLAELRPDIPIEIYPSRGGSLSMVRTASAAGIPLTTHPRLHVRGTVTSPSAIFAHTRVLVVPSVFEDPAPRVVLEAFVNGVPVIGGDRGGVPEVCAGGGFVLPIPPWLDIRTVRAVSREEARPWAELVIRLFDDDEAWSRASREVRAAGARFLAPALVRCYAEHVERLLRS